MIVLDTNVISEMTKAAPSRAVSTWLDEQPIETLFITSVTIAEIRFGISILAQGKRRQSLEEAMSRTIELFFGKILPFDERAAFKYSDLAVVARAAGRGFPTPDGYIAAIAASRGFVIATRDTAPFLAAKINTINPWTASST
ncbi:MULTISPECIES: type II toxin-antitoxin system VapC family toxin [Sphingomonadaceae]|jgi:predicted nucleic acid-binding protein|uniref:type II toxin-antitoxin system VapC family toxin n=1 Tax=Sphingomonadales TaxID=204457 RepID=UPI0006C8E336|nr:MULTISPECIES: type II toxin-antitoxin system VapC family toxin [Sphingomonadaceae]KPH63571.1 plasmid stability protein StbB [Novosphingobium sp. ST904]MDX3911041.1 type II toxin-antitoxin system VapC family toxin [Sphingobium sp.]TCM32357.1 hypothetical protein EDF59_12452 [Novosphingobium sp. ST904]